MLSSTAGKKTAAAIRQQVRQEADKLWGVLFAARRKQRGWDLEALEMATRAALHQAGAALLEQLLASQPPAEAERPRRRAQLARYREMRPNKMIAVVGEVELQRAYYPCQSCPQGQFPLDTEFDIEATQYSPGVHRMMALAGSETSFQQGREQLEVLAGLEVTTSMRPANLPHQRRSLEAQHGTLQATYRGTAVATGNPAGPSPRSGEEQTKSKHLVKSLGLRVARSRGLVKSRAGDGVH